MTNSEYGINLIYHTIGPGGGMERYVMDLITGFLNKNIKIKVIARRSFWHDPMPNAVEIFLITCPRLFGARFEDLWFEKHAESHINSSWPVIHISRIPAHSNLAISGGTHRYHLSRMNRRFYGPFHWMKIQHEQKCYSLTKKVIAHSALIAEEIAEGYQIPRERIRTIYPPVDSEKFSLNAREKRQYYRHKWGVTDGQFVLVFPSGDHQRKGADLILKALELADPRVRLAVAGRKSIDHERVINLGFQSDMPGVYAAADAAILASGYEPFGLVGPEAILCGTPVLLAETIGATEVLSAPACFKFSRTADGLARLLEQVLVLFDSGQWVLTDPEKYIHYSYQIDEHIDDVLRELK